MRVISGKYKGKKLDGFNIDGTRPTMDRVKESLFGIIQNYIKDSTVLDLFAGTGSLGIEALSNGANKCYFVDNGEYIKKQIKNNLKEITDSIFLEMDYKQAISKLVELNEKIDIIFLDPPYHEFLINDAIELIIKSNILNYNSIIICEYIDEKIIIPDNFLILKDKKYGDKRILIIKSVK